MIPFLRIPKIYLCVFDLLINPLIKRCEEEEEEEEEEEISLPSIHLQFVTNYLSV